MDLTTGAIKKHVISLAVPASIAMFFSTMLNIVDTLFAGYISTKAQASLAVSFPVFFMVIAFIQGLNTGAAALIANATGAGDRKLSAHYCAQALAYGLCFSFILTLIGVLISPPLFRLLGAADGQFLELALSYVNVIYYGAVFFVMTYASNAVLVAHGNTRTMRNFLVFSFFLNCLLDPWFLFGGFGIPAMGLPGIALATVCTMIFGTGYMLRRVIREGHLTTCSWKDFIPQLSTFGQIAYQSIPASINMMSIAIGIFVTTYYVQDFGTDAMAALGISMRVQQIFILPTIGITISTLAIIGQNNGAGRFDRMQEAISISLRYGAIIMLLGAVIMFFFPEYLLRLFTDDLDVIRVGVSYLLVAAFTTGAYLVISVHTALLQGMKHPLFALVIGICRQAIAPFCVFYFVVDVFHLGITALWWSIFAISWIAAAFAAFYARRIFKQRKEQHDLYLKR